MHYIPICSKNGPIPASDPFLHMQEEIRKIRRKRYKNVRKSDIRVVCSLEDNFLAWCYCASEALRVDYNEQHSIPYTSYLWLKTKIDYVTGVCIAIQNVPFTETARARFAGLSERAQTLLFIKIHDIMHSQGTLYIDGLRIEVVVPPYMTREVIYSMLPSRQEAPMDAVHEDVGIPANQERAITLRRSKHV